MKLYDGEKLKNARKSKGLTQDEVSGVLNIGRRQISQMENGIFDGGIKYLLKYLSLLNLELSITQGKSGWNNIDGTWPTNFEESDSLYDPFASNSKASGKPATETIARPRLAQITTDFTMLNKEIDSMFNDEGDYNE
ncbi:RodZ family helix-turn-helix domain-containing protein [Pseudoalteromonas sp. P1-8]|uniref:helix-turn-helix domain-containing protein n=1 Tax=Pseudoalteromonas sp. P1-8 TaxID=1710353 RepID=UPI0006DC755F|nr:helix-turn-helix transcriptional regulator [Pseudoalteromonas sp. P1-8]KPW03631.1 Helix-turn-helix domain protein [Pseudoalteromonas sp. P1-8]